MNPNPTVIQFFRWAAPYGVVFGLGFCAAWYIQGLRIQSAKQELVAHKQAATAQKQEEQAKHQKLNEETANDWIKNLEALHQCYRSGRCGVRPSAGGMPSGGISAPAKQPDAASANTVPAADRVAADCAETTLNLNMLQGWNEKVSK
jgi:hypothetical protein